ncbi:uncharacterized protein LOC114656136 [Erpetoichthys calabaricus]|uniref:uncharacterized protein LOC114656136 n=1 Tax=Erpetoichthys calabaricus TaxID=27687 RepID=UPI0010A0B440|nr:uncharacterized protein LOC114656136 [Erpetoichthys calabaricus]
MFNSQQKSMQCCYCKFSMQQDQPMLYTIEQRWPELFVEEQVYAEFLRITCADHEITPNITGQFYCGLAYDVQSSRGNGESTRKTGYTDHRLNSAQEKHCSSESSLLPTRAGLNFKNILNSARNIKMGILELVRNGVPSRFLCSAVNVVIVLEEEVVMENLGNFTNAFKVLFCSLYAFNMNYRKNLKYTFVVVQKVFQYLGNDYTARVQSLKNKLSANIIQISV